MNTKIKILIIVTIGLIVDQIVKFMIETNFKLYDSITIIKDFFYITYVRNTGGAWGILSDSIFFLVFITIAFIFVFIKFILKEKKVSKLQMISYSFIIGGIMGNLLDRIFRGYVVDLFHTYILNYDFPVFNVADILIVVGVGLIIIEMIGSEIYERNSRKK